MKRQKLKETKGITLVALVITIIVLLILAGVTLSMVLDPNNGLIAKAKEAANATEYAKNNEVNGINSLASEVDKYTGSTSGQTGTDPVEVKNNATTYYGALVENYGVKYDNTAGATNGWRIFYADGEDVPANERHIYLIADDYIHYDYAPQSANYTIYKNTDYKLSMNDVYQDYTGSASIDTTLGNKWLSKYWNYDSNASSKNINIRAVAYILDTSIWNTTYKTAYADYAVGGPTLEMFCKSYKDTHSDKYVECNVDNATGYKVKWNTDPDTSYNTYISGCTQDDFNSIYIKSSTSKAAVMWLASPSDDVTDGVMGAYCNGRVNGGFSSSGSHGFRPLVSLQSNIQLEKQANGNYQIK